MLDSSKYYTNIRFKHTCFVLGCNSNIEQSKPCKNLYEFANKLENKLTVEVNTLQDRNNPLLNRREVTAILRNAAGKVNRIDAANEMADKLNVDKKRVITISMIGNRGTTDVKSTFYVYNNDQELNQLPRYRVLRNMSKPDRKKLLDEEKAQKLKAKQAAAAAAKSGPGAKAKRR